MDRPVSLKKRAFEGLAQFLIALGIMVFLSAWSFRYWQGWVFWLAFSVPVTLITIYFLKKDPALIERRLKAGASAEKEPSQKLIQLLANIFFIALIVFPGIDRHLGWSHLSAYLVFLGDALLELGFLVIYFVFKENSYTSGVIEVAEKQRVVSTGPYRLVRHPMYAGALLIIVGIPLGLGSVWGMLFCLPMVGTLVWRLYDEEKYLSRNLAGYEEYRAKTRYRLIPLVY